ncbi:MAG: SDR family NAD(P)-dependent oxidoreductase [Phycisphaerae bacterium]|nr:SDR family NAD(P)-dependent oxidoreductase [Phycisphaerae bacterium]
MAEQTADLIRNNGGTALAVSSDITEPNQVKNLVTKTLEAFERIDVVFNNAGRFNCIAGVHELDPKDWWEDVRVNLFGPLLLIRQILPQMAQLENCWKSWLLGASILNNAVCL